MATYVQIKDSPTAGGAPTGGSAYHSSAGAQPTGPPISSMGSGAAAGGYPNLSYNSSAFVNPTLAAAANDSERVNKYETRLPIRLDVEAALTYVFGAVTGVLFLILETRNDYVRFHAWQSSLTFVGLGLVQFFFALFSSFLAWIVFLTQVGLIGWLGYNAYKNADTLERYELPYVGALASQWVDSE